MEKEKFSNIGFTIVESHLQIKENLLRPLEDVMGSLSPFISTKMLVVCLHVDYLWTKGVMLRMQSIMKQGIVMEKCLLLSANPISKMSHALSIVLQGLTLSVFTMILLALGFKRISFLS